VLCLQKKEVLVSTDNKTITFFSDKFKINFTDEETNLTFGVKEVSGKVVNVEPNKIIVGDNFGVVYNKSDVQGKIPFYEILSNKIYAKTQNNPYQLERPLGTFRTVKNQIGLDEVREVKRFIDFSGIFNKEENLFNITVKERTVIVCDLSNEITEECIVSHTELQNFTLKQKRNIGHSFTAIGNNWLVKFFNIFDLDPSFIDDTDTNWDAGSFVNMVTQGTGVNANLTSSADNVSGSFGSQIFDATTTANFTNITIVTQAPYGKELGRAHNDSVSVSDKDIVKFGFMNTSGLVILYYFNNETDENDSLLKDWSVDVNSERSTSVPNNGTIVDVSGDANIINNYLVYYMVCYIT